MFRRQGPSRWEKYVDPSSHVAVDSYGKPVWSRISTPTDEVLIGTSRAVESGNSSPSPEVDTKDQFRSLLTSIRQNNPFTNMPNSPSAQARAGSYPRPIAMESGPGSLVEGLKKRNVVVEQPPKPKKKRATKSTHTPFRGPLDKFTQPALSTSGPVRKQKPKNTTKPLGQPSTVESLSQPLTTNASTESRHSPSSNCNNSKNNDHPIGGDAQTLQSLVQGISKQNVNVRPAGVFSVCSSQRVVDLSRPDGRRDFVKQLQQSSSAAVLCGYDYSTTSSNYDTKFKKRKDRGTPMVSSFAMTADASVSLFVMPMLPQDRDHGGNEPSNSQRRSFLWSVIAKVKHIEWFTFSAQRHLLPRLGVTADHIDQHKDVPLRVYDIRLLQYILDPSVSCEEDVNMLLRRHTLDTRANPCTCLSSESCGRRLYVELLATCDLAKKLQSRVRDQGMQSVAEIEAKISFILFAMEVRGVGIKTDYLEQFRTRLERRRSELQAEATELLGFEINLASPKQLSEVLFSKLGLKPPRHAGKRFTARQLDTDYVQRHESTSEDTLQALTSQHKLPGLVLEHRSLSKCLTTWIIPLNERAVKTGSVGDRIHCRWEQTITGTGRLSSCEPNLQNLPASTTFHIGGDEIHIRDAIVSPNGSVLLACDYSQLEIRILAHLSGDAAMTSLLRKGGDVFVSIAAKWMGKPESEVQQTDRDRAKRLCYALIYGMGAAAAAEQLGCTVPQAMKFQDRFLSIFPKLKVFIEDTLVKARREERIHTLLGRQSNDVNVGRRRYAERQAVNSVIQGTASDIMKLAMIEVQKLLDGGEYGSHIVVQVHDELILEVPKHQVSVLAPQVRNAMESIIRLEVPLPIKQEIGLTWGTMKPIDKVDLSIW